MEGSAPIGELLDVAKQLGLEAEGKTEVHIDIPEVQKPVDASTQRLQLIQATAIICRTYTLHMLDSKATFLFCTLQSPHSLERFSRNMGHPPEICFLRCFSPQSSFKTVLKRSA